MKASAFLLLMLPSAAYAAPFCVNALGLPPQCLYYDARECEKEAGRQKAACSTNAREFTPSANIGQYCVVSHRISTCFYLDPIACGAAAAQQGGACIYVTRSAPVGAANPYGTQYGVPSLTKPAPPSAESVTRVIGPSPSAAAAGVPLARQ